MLIRYLISLFLASIFVKISDASKPNIIFIMADDLGYNDVGYHNNEVITPNIDKLASEGIILERNYVQPICTPTRSSLLTGMYPYKIGRQGLLPLNPAQPTGLTLNRTLLPELLQKEGYATHMIGKWHLGNCKKEFLPNHRGFDTFFGYWSGAETYFTKQLDDPQDQFHVNGLYDFHWNDEIFKDENNSYSLDLYTDHLKEIIAKHPKEDPMFLYYSLQTVHTPLEVPKSYEDLYPHVFNPKRKTYLGMVSAMDDLIGNLTQTLKQNNMYDNSIIIFVSDNGGLELIGGASNDPLRFGKGFFYEGGVRTPAFVHAPNLIREKAGMINEKLMHISDWFPTILSLAQTNYIPDDIDGMDLSETLFNDAPSPRKMVVNEISQLTTLNKHSYRGAIQNEDGWKLLLNPLDNALLDHWELYNVLDDPSEKHDVKNEYPEVFEMMKLQMEELFKDMVPEDFPDQVEFDVSDGQGNLATGWC